MKIQEFVGKIQDEFGWLLYLQNFLSQAIICLFVFRFSELDDLNDQMTGFLMSSVMTAEVFVLCFCSQKLTNSSEKLIDAIGNSSWYNTDIKSRKAIITFMENLKNPMKINYHGLFDVNLESFANIMNSAYSMYCILKELNTK